MSSIPDVDDVSSALRGHSRFFTEIRSVTDALTKLNHFLQGADSDSVEKLTAEFAESLSEAEECFDHTELADLSRVSQESRVADFLARIRSRVSRSRELRDRKVVHSFLNEYFDSSEKEVVAWLTEEEDARSNPSAPESDDIDLADLSLYVSMAAGSIHPHYWIDVSGSYKLANLIEMRKSQPLGKVFIARSKMNLIRRLIGHSVQRNRYVFSLDEVFHREFWHVIASNSFDQLQKLGPLSATESRELFCTTAFRGEPEQRCPAELEMLSDEIVNMCKGFPLPIVGIAGLLSKREKQEPEWQRVCSGFTVDVKTYPRILDDPARSALRNLPDYLLQCFLYLGVFPQDSAIPNEKLFRLWIAEGFVKENGEKTLEETAEGYLNELIRRNLVQTYRGYNRLEPYCRVDRLLHPSIDRSKPPRRSIDRNGDFVPRNLDSELHSLFVCDKFGDLFFTMIDVMNKCEALTALSFEYCSVQQLPEELGNLIQLKYLSLKNTLLRWLPKTVEKLLNLQTLDVRNTQLVELPAEVNKLKNFRHLLADVDDYGKGVEPTQGVRLKKGVGKLQNLRTLTTVEVHNNAVAMELAALDQLTTLSVSRLTAKTVKALCTSIRKLGRLKSLTLQATNGEEVVNLAALSSDLPLLERLVLKGAFRNLPDWIFRLRNLSVLWLSLARLTEDQLAHLSRLPNLVSLWLCRAYKGGRLCFERGRFAKLELLVLREFRGLYEMEIEDGALPCLEELRIGSSPHLDKAPSGIQYLKNLKILVNYDAPNELVVRMQPGGGSDYWKVKHIACVFFLCRVEGREYKLFELGDSELLHHFQGLDTNAYITTEPRDEHVFTFGRSGDEDDVGPLNLFRARPAFLQKNTKQSSFSSSFFSDDVEE